MSDERSDLPTPTNNVILVLIPFLAVFPGGFVAVLCFVPHSNRAPENAGPNR